MFPLAIEVTLENNCTNATTMRTAGPLDIALCAVFLRFGLIVRMALDIMQRRTAFETLQRNAVKAGDQRKLDAQP
jgi:hypothetical protein